MSDGAEIIDLTRWFDRSDRYPWPEPVESQPLYDPERLPAGYLRGARKGSGPWLARRRAWLATCALAEHRDQMLASDHQLMFSIIRWVCDNGSDLMTMSVHQIAKLAGLPNGTTGRALKRVIRDGWLTITKKGLAGKPRDGRPGTGHATTYRLMVGGRPLAVTPQAGREVPWDAKDSLNPRTLGTRTPVYIPPSGAMSPSKPGWDVTLEQDGRNGRGSELSHPNVMLEKPGRTGHAKEWLLDRLAPGPMMASDVLVDGQVEGYTERTIYRAADVLGVSRTIVTGLGGGRGKLPVKATIWSLEEMSPELEEIIAYQVDRMVTARPPAAADLCSHGFRWGEHCWPE